VNSLAALMIVKASFIFFAKQPIINIKDKLMSPRITAAAIFLLF
jgi:hypothetical protein